MIKKSVLWILMLTALSEVLAQSSCNGKLNGKFESKVLSYEDNSQSGVLNYTILIVAKDTVSIDSLNLQFTYFDSFSCNTSFPVLLDSMDSVFMEISIYYDTLNLPYFYRTIDNYIFSTNDTNDSLLYSNLNSCNVYFTPFGTTEIWNLMDFSELPRVWEIPDSIEPARVYIERDSIPVSNWEPLDSLHETWEEDYQLVFYPGLPYSIEMKALSPDSLSQYLIIDSLNNNDSIYDPYTITFTIAKKFRGRVRGMLRSNYTNDLGTEVVGGIALGGVRVNLKSWPSNLTIASAETDDNGSYDFSYSVWSFIDGQQIELYLEFETQNERFDFKVKEAGLLERTFRSTLGLPSQGKNADIQVGTITLRHSLGHPYRIVNWTYRAFRFFEDNSPGYKPDWGLNIKLFANSSAWTKDLRKITLEEGDQRHETVIWHEFGHYVMDYLLDYNLIYANGEHSIQQESNFQLAWSEGWATGFMSMLDIYFRNLDQESGLYAFFENGRDMNNLAGSFSYERRDRLFLNFGDASNGIQSEYHILCVINDLYDGPLNLPAANDFNDISISLVVDDVTNTGYDPGLFDNVSLSASDIFFCIKDGAFPPKSISEFYTLLLAKYNGNCELRRNIKILFDQNDVNLNTRSNLASDALSSDLISRDISLINTKGIFTFNTTVPTDENTLDGTWVGEGKFNIAAINSNATGILSDNLQIQNDGILFVNNNMDNGWTNLTGNFSSFPNSTMNLGICSDRIRILNDGKMIIGDENGENKAIVTLSANSILEMSTTDPDQLPILIINDNSRLIIEVGAALEYNPLSRIILNGPNAVLEIRGEIRVIDGATFTVEGGTEGLGYVRFFKNNNLTTPSLINSPTNDGNVLLTGNGRTSKLIEIDGSEGLYVGSDITNFRVTFAQIKLGNSSRLELEINGKASTNNVDVNQLYSGIKHSGIILIDCDNEFLYTSVYDGENGFTHYGITPLLLQGVLIRDCNVGILSNHSGIKFWGGKIEGYTEAGWKSVAPATNSILKNVTIDNTNNVSTANGISIKGGNGSFANTILEYCTIRDNFNGALVDNSNLELTKCNSFKDNATGIDMENSNLLDMDDNSYTNFDNNGGHVLSRYHGELKLNKGHNGFVNQNPLLFITAFLEPVKLLGQLSSGAYLANDNYFDGTLSPQLTFNSTTHNYTINSRGTTNYYSLGTNNTYTTKISWNLAKGTFCTPGDWEATSETSQGKVFSSVKYAPINLVPITCSPYSNISVVAACTPLIDSLHVSMNPDFNAIIYGLGPVINCNYPYHTDLMHELQRELFLDFQSAYARGIASGQIYVSTDSISPKTDDVIDVIDGLLDKAYDTIMPWDSLKYELTLAKAEVYRLSEQREESIDILTDALIEFEDSLEQLIIQRNICINEAEIAYLNGDVSLDSIYIIYTCFTPGDSMSFSRQLNTRGVKLSDKSSEAKVLKLYPNPTSFLLTAEVSDKEVIKQIAIYDMRGILIRTIECDNETGSRNVFSTDGLSTGNYFIHVVTTNNVFNKSFSVIR